MAGLSEVELAVLEGMIQSDGYGVLDEWLAGEQDNLRGKLEKMNVPEREADYIRGRLYTLASLRREAVARTFRHAQERPG
jgi:hypothetical protein